MEVLYYFRQWPGNFMSNVWRMCHILLLEAKRIFTGTKYIAEFDLTDKCNLSCPHCYHFRENNHLQYTECSIETWELKFKALKKSGVRRVLLIGGEPALRMDVIDLACRFFKYVDICTNGTIKIDIKYPVKLFVSVDGDIQTHDAIRGKGVYQKVMANYKGDHRVVFSMTLTGGNWQQLEEVILMARQQNVRGVSCDMYTPSVQDVENDSLFLSNELRKRIITELFRLKKKYPDLLLMSQTAINWFSNPNHLSQQCYWRDAVLHFNAALEERFSCKDLNCKYCGHFAQANLSPFNKFLKNN